MDLEWYMRSGCSNLADGKWPINDGGGIAGIVNERRRSAKNGS